MYFDIIILMLETDDNAIEVTNVKSRSWQTSFLDRNEVHKINCTFIRGGVNIQPKVAPRK